MATTAQLTEYLDRALDWPRDHTPCYVPRYDGQMWPERDEPGTLAQALLADAGFRALRLADWSETQQGQLIIEAVETLSPPLYRQDERLIAAALNEAVTLQRQGQAEQARAVALAAVLVGAGLAALWWLAGRS